MRAISDIDARTCIVVSARRRLLQTSTNSLRRIQPGESYSSAHQKLELIVGCLPIPYSRLNEVISRRATFLRVASAWSRQGCLGPTPSLTLRVFHDRLPTSLSVVSCPLSWAPFPALHSDRRRRPRRHRASPNGEDAAKWKMSGEVSQL